MNDFQLGDIVLYGSNGCCRVDDIETRDAETYYILRPVHKDRTKLLVPLSNERLVSRMRPIPTRNALHDVIARAVAAETTWVDNVAQRKEQAKATLAAGDEYDLLVLVRSFSEHRSRIEAAGKKATSSDSYILRSAQEHIRDEFSIVFEIDPAEVDEYISIQAQAV